MKLSDEVFSAAQTFGQILGETTPVEEFKKAEQIVKNDLEATGLENRLEILYSHLASQEQANQALEQGELDEYYLLRRKVVQNSLISAREDQKQMVKVLFADVNQTMTSILGIDFTILTL